MPTFLSFGLCCPWLPLPPPPPNSVFDQFSVCDVACQETEVCEATACMAKTRSILCTNTYRVQIPDYLVKCCLPLLLRHEIAFYAVYRSPSFT
jgi:hypothetical protein